MIGGKGNPFAKYAEGSPEEEASEPKDEAASEGDMPGISDMAGKKAMKALRMALDSGDDAAAWAAWKQAGSCMDEAG